MASQYNIIIDQKATYADTIIYNDSNGDPVDLTGYEARVAIKASHDQADGDALVDIDSSSGGTGNTSGIALNSSGEIAIVISDIETTALDPGSYVWDLKLTEPSGRSRRLVEGSVTVTPGVTP